eukprot:gene217-232_t
MLPAPPSKVLNQFGLKLQAALALDLQEILSEQQAEDENRSQSFDLQKRIAVATNKLLESVRNGDIEVIASQTEACQAMQTQMLDYIHNDPYQRESRVSHLIERSVVSGMLYHFYTQGSIPTRLAFANCTDDEYLGALTGFSQELSRYVINRACENDVQSIEISRLAVLQINEALLSLDFRNGPLRRKYDSVKYAVKAIESAAFELSLASDAKTPLFSDVDEGSASKRARLEEPASASPDVVSSLQRDYIDKAEIAAIQQRMEAFDKCREQVIKDCRDVQKLSKQAIFALQRRDLVEAEKKLLNAKIWSEKIIQAIVDYPILRSGALANALEEWAEGMLLLGWLSNRQLPTRKDLSIVSPNEYIGGLSDFTGEIGRIAVALAARRDLEGVREVQQAMMVTAQFITEANVSSNRYSKKLEAVQTNLRKVEDIVYELTLAQRSSRVSRLHTGLAAPAPVGENTIEDA